LVIGEKYKLNMEIQTIAARTANSTILVRIILVLKSEFIMNHIEGIRIIENIIAQ
jgi:hypothetical protein